MNASANLTSLLEEWRELTEREYRAILAGNWTLLTEHQSRKKNLREAITRLRGGESAALPDNKDAAGAEPRSYDLLLSELMVLESRNHDLLSARRQGLLEEKDRLNAMAHNLHGVRRAYGRSHAHHWHSYS